MIRYKMFEREITKGNHQSYHVCVDKFNDYDIDLLDYECNITLPNDYIHVSCLKRKIDDYVRQSVLDYFNIDVNFPVIYFTRKIPFTTEFKCGFYLNTYKKFKSKYLKQTLSTMKLFRGLYNDIFLAGDFTSDGRFIDESINIEIMPIQSREVYFKIRDLLLDNFEIDNFDSCDGLFTDYKVDKFHFHVKIKYSSFDTIVKFYNTYPINPFINYYDNKKNFK